MDININDINRSFKLSRCDDSYINYCENKLLKEGKANLVFLDVVMKRIKLAYKGRVTNDDGFVYGWYDKDPSNKLVWDKNQFRGIVRDLISNNGMHCESTEIFGKLAMNEGLKYSYDEEYSEIVEKFKEDNDLENLFLSMIEDLDWCGSLLVKYIEQDKDYYLDYVTISNYFPIFSRYSFCKVIAYVEYLEIKDDVYLFTVHTEKYKRRFVGKISIQDEIEEVQATDELLAEIGLTIDDLNDENIDSWQVAEIKVKRSRGRAYGDSNYSYPSKSNLRDYIVIDTAEGQSIDTYLKPTILASEDFAERTRDDKAEKQLDMTQDVIFWGGRADEKPFFEVVKNEYNFEGSKSIKEQKELAIYRALNFNETATGTGEKGYNSISGKMIDMTVPIQRATELYNAVAKGMKYICNLALEKQGINANLSFVMGSPMTLTQKEKIENAGLEIDYELKSKTESIADYRNLSMEEAKEKYEEIKKENEVAIFTETDI